MSIPIVSAADEAQPAPQLKLNPNVTDIGDFEAEDFEVVGYKSHPAIRGQVAI